MLPLIDIVLVSDDAELAEGCGKHRLGDPMDEALVTQPVGDQVRDRNEGETVLLREYLELRAACNRAVLVEDLTDHAGRRAISQPRDIDGRFRLSDALEHATLLRPQWKDVPWSNEVRRMRPGIHRDLDRPCPVPRTDSR